MAASLQACGVVFPFAMPTSICRSIVTICSGLYLWMGMTCFSSKWILSHSTWYKFRRSGQKFAEAVEGFLTWEQIREYLHQGPIQREPSRRTTLESITRSVRIVGGILQSLGKETKGVGGILVRAGGALWWLVQAAIPEGLTGHFAGKIFASFFWFAIVMIIGGTFFNQAVQSVGLKLLFFTTLLWLVKDAFQRYIQGGRRALRITAVWAVLALLIGVGAWASLQKLQRSEPPEKAYQYVHDLWCGCKTPNSK
jgi:hypothetical protein